MKVQEAKDWLRIPELWRRLNLPGDCSKNPCKSPFREDRKPSFSVSADGRLFNDLTTGQGGDAIDFLQLATGLSRAETCKRFIAMAGGMPSEPLPAIKRSLAHPQEAQRPLPKLPARRTGTPAEHEALAKLRSLSLAAVKCADVQAGILRFGQWRGQAAWFITDQTGRSAQARRMDGKTWEGIGAKAQTLPGCFANWPIGAEYAATHPCVLLVEGGPDLLAGIHFALQEGRSDCFPVAMLGASQRIHAQALPHFAGKRVRIYGHADEPGRQAAERWAAQLATVGADVDCFDFTGLRKADGSPVKDLNDCTQIHPDDATELKGILPNE